MLYKVSPFGYFGRVQKLSRGPWFQERNVEDDGLEYFYVFGGQGEPVYLLSNNLPIEDRDKLERLYKSFQRNRYLAWFGGYWVAAETILRVPYFRKMAIGWRALSFFATAFVAKNIF